MVKVLATSADSLRSKMSNHNGASRCLRKKTMKPLTKLVLLAPVLTLLSGCASIFAEDVQEIKVALMCKNRPVAVSCTASNDLGRWEFSSPGSVLVRNDSSALQVSCRGRFVPKFAVSVPPMPSWTMAGNLLAGGLVGAALDVYSGVGLRYPENVDINNPSCN